ncbi:sn-glycerol-3-phosphate-binding periplasmic protein UgpB precursor [Pigmentiphaga humi]|uniref:sn-glycerol-3-phosphate-binding periplasmic protein UgpB n=1 Tax=Pigmentiphaga humi TaxID=2478468 RepID=A0A3P4AZT1_9BURK|nr:extracellular solute-binding protein [Pigmentiphaga humi]VCU69081.1 sn-glycerol-3-phosphate-binding periplasmic protein UgpB precursor [Pigmentiphaga humi]
MKNRLMQPNGRWLKWGVSALSAGMLALGGAGMAAAQGAKKSTAKPAAKPAGKAAASKAPAKKPAAAGAAAGAAAAGAAAAMQPQNGPIELQVWHTMNAEQAREFDSLVQRFNDQGHGFTVKVTAKPSPEALIDDGLAAVRARRAPHLVELPDYRSPEFIARQGAILPMYELLAKYPVKDLRWFLPQTTSTMRDARGRLLALPWMADVPVYYYNRDLYQRAGLNPDAPPRTWREMQGHLIALNQNGVDCPYASSWQTWVHIENLSAMHNVAYATRNNGLDGANGAQLLANNLLHVRHMALMMSWVRSQLFPVRSERDQADAQFASGQCAVLTSGTSALAQIQEKAKFSYGIAPLPYYEEEATRPATPFVGGSAFWALAGHATAEQKALATFIAYLASPVVAAEWHQKSGFLPLTEASYRASEVSYYKSIPGAMGVIESMSRPQQQFTRGFRLNHYDRVSQIMDNELDAIWNGSKPPKQGLDDAVTRASAVMNGKAK